MSGKKLSRAIETHFRYHGLHLKLHLIKADAKRCEYIFQILPYPGTKVAKIFDCAPDIKVALQLPVFQTFRDGIKLYLKVGAISNLRNDLIAMLRSDEFQHSPYSLPVALGYNIWGKMVFVDLKAMPHMMYAGTTNSGKSVGLRCLLLSLIIGRETDDVNFVIIDAGAHTLDCFEGLPHLSAPIARDFATAAYYAAVLAKEMDRRMDLPSQEVERLPSIVCVIDEFASLISGAENQKAAQELADSLSEILRRGRHAGIHVVVAAQDPTLKNIRIELANITARVAFACAKPQNSLTILGEGGAEKLSGNGAMLFKSNQYPSPINLQGAYISQDNCEKIVALIKGNDCDCEHKFSIKPYEDELHQVVLDGFTQQKPVDRELGEIVIWALQQGSISANKIMGKFHIGGRAYKIIDQLEEWGLVSEKHANQPRRVLADGIDSLPESVLNFLQECGYVLNVVSDKMCEDD